MQNIEKLGTFYLGSEINESKAEKDLVLYDSKDLTTHSVIIGMTGSGKTGLGVCMIEEALLDGIPVIAIDPKGDLGNLLLTFPNLATSDFKDWIDPLEAEKLGKTVDELAAEKAKLWQNGIEKTGQSKQRIKQLRETVDMNLFTPGSNVGRPISLLKSLNSPPENLRNDKDLYRERIAAATTGILSLLDIENNPLSKEHTLVSNILEYFWDKEQSVSLEDLIMTVQKPPFERIGVMDLETIYPQKERTKLAMKINNLIASPSFEAWTQGQPLDAKSLLFGEKGKPQLSVMNIAHLSDNERIFFVTMLLNEILAWMRTQPGTGSLRAILYIDEIFGYMPPVGNPATKTLLLTLLKQARAYGVGLVLSTQNPVDLDYKGLSNTGTWFIGKLQTEQDRARVMSGLLSATEDGFDKKELNEAFNQLGKRKFLMHNIHESEPVIMTTRWAMSYLAGPLSRQQIKKLCANIPAYENNIKEKTIKLPETNLDIVENISLASDIEQYYLPPTQVVTDYSKVVYKSCLLCVSNISYDDTKSNIHHLVEGIYKTEFSDGAIAIDWRNSVEKTININLLSKDKPKNSLNINPIAAALRANYYKDWEKSFKTWAKQNKILELFKHSSMNLFSKVGESESEFRQRIDLSLRENRDLEIEKLRKTYSKKLDSLSMKLKRAEIKVDKESEQASGKTLDAILGAGTALFSMFFGRKKVSATNARKISTALKKAKGAFSERDDVGVAKELVEIIEKDILGLETELTKEINNIKEQFDSGKAVFETVQIYPKSTGIDTKIFALGWEPGIIINGNWTAV